MFCPRCGMQLHDDAKFCTNCGAAVPKIVPFTTSGQKVKEPVTGPQPAAQKPAQAQRQVPPPKPSPKTPPKAPPKPSQVPALDVKKIITKPPVILALKESMDFKAAEDALESGGLKTKAFSGFFGGPQPTDLRVESLTKIYEPIHLIRATYRGIFEVLKEFNLPLDPDTIKVIMDSKVHDIESPPSAGGFFSSSAPTLKLTVSQIVNKVVEKSIYYDLNWAEKPVLENYIRDKPTVQFNPEKPIPRSAVLGTQAAPQDYTTRVLTPQIIQRPPVYKTLMEESITIETQTIYYPKYKALVANLKNNQRKYLIISAVDKQILPSETF